MKNVSALITLSLIVLFAVSAQADQVSVLGTADSYAVLGASTVTVTTTGNSVLYGNLGLSPGTSITGSSNLTVYGSTDSGPGPGPAATAQADALAGYTHLSNLSSTTISTGVLDGTFTPGVYSFSSSAGLTDTLTLNFEDMDDADIVFQIGSALTTASYSTVDVINQGLDDNVYFQVGSSATLGTYSTFQGDILADQSITLNTGADITCGSAIALNAAVTLDTNTITNCSTTGSDVTPAGGSSTTPEPASLWLLATGLLGGAGLLRRRLVA